MFDVASSMSLGTGAVKGALYLKEVGFFSELREIMVNQAAKIKQYGLFGGRGGTGEFLDVARTFDRNAITKGFQDHHIISNKNVLTKDHELLELADFNLESHANKIFLQTDASLHPTRSIHLGRHANIISQDIAERMRPIIEVGKEYGWTKLEYNQEIRNMLSDLRQELKLGNVALNKDMRPWATKNNF